MKLRTPADNDEDSPFLDYVQVKRDGSDDYRAAWFHPDHDEPLVGPELGEQAADPDEWSLRWYCPRCGTYQDEIPDTEIDAAGMSSTHTACASDGEQTAADEAERAVATNLRNAQAFEAGAFDNTEDRQ